MEATLKRVPRRDVSSILFVSLVREIAADAAAQSDPDACLRHLRGGLIRLGFTRAGIWIADPQDPARFHGTWGTDWDGNEVDEHGLIVSIGDFHGREGIAAGERISLCRVVDPGDRSVPANYILDTTSGPPNAALVALRADGQLLGVISVDMLPSDRTLTPEHTSALCLLADQVAVAIARSHLVAELRAANEKLRAELRAHEEMARELRASEERYRSLFDEVPIGLYRTTPDGEILKANPALVQMLGYADEDELRAVNVEHTFVDRADRARYRAILEREGAIGHFEMRLRRRDGTIIWVEDSARAIYDSGGTIVAFKGILRDITGRKLIEEALQLRERQQAALAALSQLALAGSRVDDLLDAAVATVAQTLELTPVGIWQLKTPECLLQARAGVGWSEDRRGPLVALTDGFSPLKAALAQGDPVVVDDLRADPRFVAAVLPERDLASGISVVISGHEGPFGVLGAFSRVRRQFSSDDVYFVRTIANTLGQAIARAEADEALRVKNAALASANARLLALSTTDPLTDLPNHRALHAAIEQEIERARRLGRSCSLLFLDLDHFKGLNDTYGHPVGDATLRELGEVIRRALRRIDTVGRWGGEEFVVLLPGADATTGLQVAERVRETVATHPFRTGGRHLTCSIGVAAYPDDASSRDELVAAADRAMYVAKRLGRNQVRAASEPAVQALPDPRGLVGSRDELALVGTVEALAAVVEARDRATGVHTEEVAILSGRLAAALGLGPLEVRGVTLAARLHDLGKVGVPDAILQKPSVLTAQEEEIVHLHPIVGATIVSYVPALRNLAPIIRSHHERWDGGGYPDGLAGEEIPLGARIVAVADAYGAMTEGRPYYQAVPPAVALAELKRCAGGQFDPQVVAALEQILSVESPLSIAS